MKTTSKPMGLRQWMLIVVLSVLWGGSFFFNGVLVQALPRFTIVALRVAIAAVALNVVIRATGQRMPGQRRIWAAFFVMGLLNNMIPFSLIVTGQTRIGSGLAAILNATTPLFTVVVAHFLTDDEQMTRRRLLGVLIGLVGVAVVIGLNALRSLGDQLWAQLAVLGAALSYALAGIYGRRFGRQGVAPVVTANGQVTASAVVLLPLALLVDRPWTLPAPPPQAWAAMLGLALFSTALAYVVYFRLLATAGASNALLVTFLIPVSAILLGAAFLGERLGAQQLAGMALIGVGLATIDGRVLRLLRGAAHAAPARG